ncbi:MAG: DUF2071 domain-containing protein [Acidobacteriota bacterium]
MSTFLTAHWRNLIMAQYEVAPATLAPYLPEGLELDYYKPSGALETDARCYVSLVGFLFDRVRIMHIPPPLHTRFEEINLRFYVRRLKPDGSYDRGVVFIREFVPSPLIAFVAKSLYEEPYATAPVASGVSFAPGKLSVEYRWTFGGGTHRLQVEASPNAEPIAMGSEEEFITEHYWGFTKRSNGTTSAYQVEHPRWQTHPVQNYTITANFLSLYGPAFAPLNYQQPMSVLLAEGSAVSVSSGVTL